MEDFYSFYLDYSYKSGGPVLDDSGREVVWHGGEGYPAGTICKIICESLLGSPFVDLYVDHEQVDLYSHLLSSPYGIIKNCDPECFRFRDNFSLGKDEEEEDFVSYGKPGINGESIMKFGKHKGEKLKDIPDSYWKYMLSKDYLSDDYIVYCKNNLDLSI